MTVSKFIHRIQQKVQMLSTDNVPIKLNGQDVNCVIELIENGKGYYINIKQSQKDFMLTWIDIRNILSIAQEVEDENDDCPLLKSELCDEILRRFNEQKKK